MQKLVQDPYRLHLMRLFIALGVLPAAALLPSPGMAAPISVLTAGGYTFANFDPTLTGNEIGSNANGISNAGQLVGTAVDTNNAFTFANYSGVPGNTTALDTGAGQIALGINRAGTVVGGNGITAFVLPHGGTLQALTAPSGAINAFGINDSGNIVGQFNSAQGTTPGFYLPSAVGSSFITIDAPSGPNIVNAQAVNNHGLIAGFYLGTDGQDHGFDANVASASNDVLTGTAIADPSISMNVPGEPGATFVFSQILGLNDSGIAVGYYGDSTNSQHGFIYNTDTRTYTFVDDPAEAFNNGVEVTQITGIADSGELSGFYTDARGLPHSFAACPVGVACPPAVSLVPEPASLALLGAGLLGLGVTGRRRRAH